MTRGCVAVLAMLGAAAVAPECAADPIDPRLDLLDRDAAHARTWWWTFTLSYAAIATAQTTLAITVDTPTFARVDSIVGAVDTWLGFGGMLIGPIPRVWRAAADAHRTGDVASALTRAADAEAEARGWWNHVLAAAVGLGSGAVLLWGYDRPVPAALSAASGIVVGELNLWTTPARVLHLRDHGMLTASFVPVPGGLGVAGAW